MCFIGGGQKSIFSKIDKASPFPNFRANFSKKIKFFKKSQKMFIFNIMGQNSIFLQINKKVSKVCKVGRQTFKLHLLIPRSERHWQPFRYKLVFLDWIFLCNKVRPLFSTWFSWRSKWGARRKLQKVRGSEPGRPPGSELAHVIFAHFCSAKYFCFIFSFRYWRRSATINAFVFFAVCLFCVFAQGS